MSSTFLGINGEFLAEKVGYITLKRWGIILSQKDDRFAIREHFLSGNGRFPYMAACFAVTSLACHARHMLASPSQRDRVCYSKLVTLTNSCSGASISV